MHTIKLDNFEGPLDLLLHLIEDKKMDIKDIQISNVIDEYLEIIWENEKHNLKIKVEFLQMASVLIEIKSKSILRKDTISEEEKELEIRLKEYKLFKEFSKMFSENETEFYQSYSKNNGVEHDTVIVEHDNTFLTHENLEKCLNDLVLKLIGNKNAIKIEIDEEFTSNDAKLVIDRMCKNDKVSFNNLLEKKITKKRIVVLFITILELYKENKIDIIIDEDTFYVLKGKNV